ncbi:hypothetical protein BDZ91DRAFT_787573 [Kalaharituber pfeilii]|nr:hypothetical protein BDZ91DRAFT_787573 [Kalaharituber pfeilii]
MVVPTPSSCRSPSLQPVHYLNSGIAVPIPPYGVVESYDEELEPEDTCARPLSLRNGNGIRKPELDGTPKNGVALNREGGHDLLTVAREFQERIERFLESEVHTKVLRDVQRQTRISLEVVEQALRSYQ